MFFSPSLDEFFSIFCEEAKVDVFHASSLLSRQHFQCGVRT